MGIAARGVPPRDSARRRTWTARVHTIAYGGHDAEACQHVESRHSRAPDNWGASAAEHNRPYLADELLTGPIRRLSRAVTAHAPAALTYRWLCQTAVAPYSYDWLDNLGCRSPQQLTPGAENLEIGQAVMVFELVDVQPGYQFTGRGLPRAERLFGPLAATYAVESVDSDSSRLICRLAVAEPSGLGRLRAVGLAWGDVVMMRRQLLNLAGLAERDAVTLTSRA